MLARTLLAFLLAGTLAHFSLLAVAANRLDWDHFLTSMEVDRRGWLVDAELPLWSYQFCGGTTRIGDPQTYGLSPLFLVVLLLGSFWGAKVALLLSALVGLYYTKRLIELVATEEAGPKPPDVLCYALASLFILNNHYLWHLLVGHYTFSTEFYGLGILYYTLRGYRHGLRRTEFLAGTAIAWQHYSGAPFHSTVYFLAPALGSFALYALGDKVLLWQRRSATARLPGRRPLHAVAFHLAGALLASYRLYHIWHYHRLFPRLREGPATEVVGLLSILTQHLVPTLGPRYAFDFAAPGPWEIHEYSAFSLSTLLCVAAGAIWAWRRVTRGRAAGRFTDDGLSLRVFLPIYFLASVSLSVGDFSSLAPFSLLNRLMAPNVVRGVGRFAIGVTLSACLALGVLLRAEGRAARRYGAALATGLLVLLNLNLSTFHLLADVPRTREFALLPGSDVPEMRTLFTGETFDGATSYMFAPARLGVAIIHCYNSLPREAVLADVPVRAPSFIDTEINSPSAACLRESYFTQRRIHVAPSCPRETCLYVSGRNLYDRQPELRYNPLHRRYCWYRD
jgi:hypothetical protein